MTEPEASHSASPGFAPKAVERVVQEAAIEGSAGMTYRPLLELGEGGMARIVLALATGPSGFNKLVVLKVMRTGQDTTSIRRLLLAEARLSARLNHPNVVQVHEVVHTAESPYLVMEYLDGRPLSSLRGSLSASMMMTVISEALVGLHYAHELSDFDGTPLGIVHRDVSPHNIVVTYDGVVKVLDFGIAKMHSENSNTETGEVKGKLAYMPPEQLLGEPVDRRADIFAIGGMLWEVATGVKMWANVSQAQLMHRLMIGDIPRPSSVATVADELERIIMRATAAQPADRYDSALALRQDLDAFLEESGQRVPLRDVGATLAETFKQERLERARSIKEALKHNAVAPATKQELDLITGSQHQLARVPPRKGLFVVGGLAALAILGLGIAVHSWRGSAPSPPVAAPPATISLSVHASPSHAKISIDHREYAQSNLALTLPRDTRMHSLEVFAPGFIADTRSLSFDRSVTLEVALRAVDPPSATPPLAAASAAVSGRRGGLAGAPRGKAGGLTTSGSTPHGPAGALPNVPPAPADECNPPYYFDHGIKTYKPRCL